MKINPQGSRLVIETVPLSEKSAGGIFIPETAKEKPKEGTVIAVGPGCTSIKENDLLVFSPYAGSELLFEGKHYLILEERDVLAIITS